MSDETPAAEETGTWIEFYQVDLPRPRKTKRWGVYPRGKTGLIGWILWYPPWRKYAFYPGANTVYEQVCLREIAEFIERKTREHKEARKK